MSGMAYDEAATARLESIYLGHDVVKQRANTLKLLNLKAGEAVLDIGSGPGFLVSEMAAQIGPEGRVQGVDVSAVMIERSKQRNSLPPVDFKLGNATHLPESDQSFDVVVSTQVAEYVPDIDRFCSEAFRVLHPGGRALFVATDWTALAWHSTDPARMNAVLNAFIPHCAHAQLPRVFSPLLRKAGFEITQVSAFPILNTAWSEGAYSCLVIPFIIDYVRSQNTISSEVLDAWAQEQRDLGESNAYYFLTSRVFFAVRRPL